MPLPEHWKPQPPSTGAPREEAIKSQRGANLQWEGLLKLNIAENTGNTTTVEGCLAEDAGKPKHTIMSKLLRWRQLIYVCFAVRTPTGQRWYDTTVEGVEGVFGLW